jgi:hypothetical protein
VSDRPSSLAQFVKLGKRLAQPGDPSSADLVLLQEWLLAYDAPLTYVTQRLSQHGLQPVHRIKTTPVLIEKLRRSPGIAITHIRDIAGARLVVRDMTIPAGTVLPVTQDAPSLTLVREVPVSAGGLLGQEVFTQMIMRTFDDDRCAKPAKLIDHIREPNHGYRAKHVVVYPDGLPVEIQVRTPLQHQWAELNEKLGDRWGRGLRYGDGPDDPDRHIQGEGSLTRRGFVDALQRLSDTIADFERGNSEVQAIEIRIGCLESPIHDKLVEDLKHVRALHRAQNVRISAMLEALLGIVDRLEAP